MRNRTAAGPRRAPMSSLLARLRQAADGPATAQHPLSQSRTPTHAGDELQSTSARRKTRTGHGSNVNAERSAAAESLSTKGCIQMGHPALEHSASRKSWPAAGFGAEFGADADRPGRSRSDLSVL